MQNGTVQLISLRSGVFVLLTAFCMAAGVWVYRLETRTEARIEVMEARITTLAEALDKLKTESTTDKQRQRERLLRLAELTLRMADIEEQQKEIKTRWGIVIAGQARDKKALSALSEDLAAAKKDAYLEHLRLESALGNKMDKPLFPR